MFGLQVQGQHLTFESPSAFSIYLKRLVNPARKADDGWKTVKCNGRFLEQYKLELARRRFGKPDDDSAGNTPSTWGSPSAAHDTHAFGAQAMLSCFYCLESGVFPLGIAK